MDSSWWRYFKIETIKLKGKGDLKVTGNLGDVMKESSFISYAVVKHLIDNNILKIDENQIPKQQKRKKNTKLDSSEIYKDMIFIFIYLRVQN